MTNPHETFSPPSPGTCDAFQWEISQALDERNPIPARILAHLAGCAECAAFAETWGADGSETSRLAETPMLEPALQSRLLAGTFREETHSSPARHASGAGALAFRWVAVLALLALGWWLLDPQVAPPPPATAPGSATVAQAVSRQASRLQAPLAGEQLALRGAVADGAAHLRDVFAWSFRVVE